MILAAPMITVSTIARASMETVIMRKRSRRIIFMTIPPLLFQFERVAGTAGRLDLDIGIQRSQFLP